MKKIYTYRELEDLLMSVKFAYRSKSKTIIEALVKRKELTQRMNRGETPSIDDNYWCKTCGSHSHEEDPRTAYCFICNTDNWEPEKKSNI